MNQQQPSEGSVAVTERVCFADVTQVVKTLEEHLKAGFVVSGIALLLTGVPTKRSGTPPTKRPSASDGRITARQLKAIFAIGKGKGMTNQDIRGYTQEIFGKLPDFLTRAEASTVIEQLQEDGQ